MPFLLPAAASAVAAAAPAAAAAGASAAASAGIGATLTSIAGNVLMNVAISAAMSIFQPQVGVAGRTFEWTLDPDGPIPFAAGRIGVPGSAVYRKTFGPDLMYYGIPSVISGAGPIDGYEAFLADDESVTFDGSGKAVSSQYAGELWYKNKLGTQPDTAITSPTGLKNGATLPGWTSAHKLSGKACYMIVMGENSKGTAFPTGEIKPLITLRGLKVYDPRLDSTYPGGSGSHRLANPATWTYSANPILWALKWTLGLWEGPNGKGAPQVDYQVGGIGAKLSGIDVPAFVAAANVADANGWTCAAYPTTDDDKHQVLTGFLQAGGAIYAQRAGKISCIQRAAPRTSIVTVSAYDTAGPLEIDTAASRIDRINTLRPRFWSEPHRWQMTALDQEVTAQAYRDEDGGVRPSGIDYPYVTNARQAGQLAALQIANTREGIAGVIPLKPHLQRIRPGDAFTITEAGFVLNGLKCLCLNTDYDPATGVVRVSFVSETDAKYPFALGQNPTPPTPQVLTPVDPRFVSPPGAGDWTITPRPPAPGGGQLPGFDLGGTVSNNTATAIIVETGPTATGPWTQAYQGPPTVTNIPIDGLQPGATYYVAIQYQRNQNYSERHVYGPYTAPALDPGPNAPSIAAIRADIEAAFGDISDIDGLLSQARSDIDAQGEVIDGVLADVQALDTGLNGVQQVQATQQTQIDGKASQSDLNATIVRVQNVETVNGTQTTQIADLNTGKASVQRVDFLEARQGQTRTSIWPSQFALSGTSVPDWSATLDGVSIAPTAALTTTANRGVRASAPFARVLWAKESRALAPIGDALPVVAGRKYRVRLAFKTAVNRPDGAASSSYFRFRGMTSAGVFVANFGASFGTSSGRLADGWRYVDTIYTVSTADAAAYGLMRPIVVLNSEAVGTGYGEQEIAYLEVTDVTQEQAQLAAITALQAVDIDLENNKASAVEFNAIKAEVTAARNGRANVSAELSAMRTATATGDEANATAISNLTARTENTEADILGLESAVATEAGARADAIQQVSAGIPLANNEFWNADFSQGDAGFNAGWDGGTGVQPTRGFYQNFVFLKKNGSCTSAGFAGSWWMEGGPAPRSAVAFGLKSWRVYQGEKVGFAAEFLDEAIGGGYNPVQGRIALHFFDVNGSYVQDLAPEVYTAQNTGWHRRKILGVAPADGFVAVEVNVYGSNGAASNVSLWLRQPVFARLRPTATDVPAYSAPAGGGQVNDLRASITEQSLAIVDLENQQALASWNVIANATGGRPARIGLTSSSLGSFVALDAPFIFWGDNTVFDDATDTLQTTVGGYRRVLAFGAPFGSGGTLLEWWGPANVALGAMTTANGLNGRMTTAPYIFDNVIGVARFQPEADAALRIGTRTSAGQVTTTTVTIAPVGATGTVAYAWSQIGGSEEWTITAPSAGATAFRVNVATPGEQKRATFACRVSDAGTGKTATVIVGAVAIYNV